MSAMLLCLFQFVRLMGSGNQAIALENLALRRQPTAYRKKRKRSQLTRFDRWFWADISYVWKDWLSILVFVTGATQERRRRAHGDRESAHPPCRPRSA